MALSESKKRIVNRVLRVAAFGGGSAIIGLGAGNVLGFSAAQSAGFGAAMAMLGLIGALLFIFAGKGAVPDQDFDTAINSAIENVQSKSEK